MPGPSDLYCKRLHQTTMTDLKPYVGRTKLVVGFDIGGVSYCILERGRVPEILGVMTQILPNIFL